uniref:Uncharacterized protein n=1 Tax=Panagrolaimus sp. JU765 TaxID=591449 RepID=A0AC34Q292_9BILA
MFLTVCVLAEELQRKNRGKEISPPSWMKRGFETNDKKIPVDWILILNSGRTENLARRFAQYPGSSRILFQP